MQIWSALQLLSAIYTECHSVILDEEGKILDEYEPYLKEENALGKWFTSMTQEPRKLISRPRGHLELNINLDPDDLKFLEVAINTPHKIIVTGDSDFLTIRGDQQIRNLGIRILTVDEALKEL